MAEGVVILATLSWGGGLYLTFTGRMLLGALTSVAAWAVWLVFSITTHNQVAAMVAEVSLAISLELRPGHLPRAKRPLRSGSSHGAFRRGRHVGTSR